MKDNEQDNFSVGRVGWFGFRVWGSFYAVSRPATRQCRSTWEGYETPKNLDEYVVEREVANT